MDPWALGRAPKLRMTNNLKVPTIFRSTPSIGHAYWERWCSNNLPLEESLHWVCFIFFYILTTPSTLWKFIFFKLKHHELQNYKGAYDGVWGMYPSSAGPFARTHCLTSTLAFLPRTACLYLRSLSLPDPAFLFSLSPCPNFALFWTVNNEWYPLFCLLTGVKSKC